MYLHTLSLHDALPISYVAIRSGFGARLAEAAMRAAGERLDELDVLPTQAFRIDAETIALLIDRGNSEAVTRVDRSEEHTSELQSLMRISYAVFCLKKKNTQQQTHHLHILTHHT